MLEIEVSRIVRIAQGEEKEVNIENLMRVIDGLNAFIESE